MRTRQLRQRTDSNHISIQLKFSRLKKLFENLLCVMLDETNTVAAKTVVTVVILLTSDAVKEDGEGISRLSDIDELNRPGVVLTPNDPGSDDEELRRYYSVELENEQDALGLVNKLLGMDAVEAAFIKPKGEPPG